MIKSSCYLMFCLVFLFSMPELYAQTLAQKLGYDVKDKLLIIHADDLGVAHSENEASTLGMRLGSVNSASIMMPCPWVSEIMVYASEHPGLDLGLHLTVTSEWKGYKWGPVAPKGQVSSLINEFGYFYDNCREFGANAQVDEVYTELKAQVEQSLKMGLDPTHLDTHMGCLIFTSPEIFELYLKIGREYQIPVMIDKVFLKSVPAIFSEKISDNDIIIDRIYTAGPADAEKGMANFYINTIENLEPGVSTILIHLAFNDSEMQGMTVDHPDWGAKWRQDDFDFFASDECKRVLKENGVKLITWREIQEKMVR